MKNSDKTLADSNNEPAFLLDENTQDYERATIEDDILFNRFNEIKNSK